MGRRKKVVTEVAQVVQAPKEEKPEKNMKFYLIVYLTDGTIHWWPGNTKEECAQTKAELLKTKWKPRISKFKVVKRNLNNYKDGCIV